ncbi:hypothetical protein BDW74DRAFT_176657 [Aspergillus multicolor]|uniref:putative glycosyl hydrolase n=1 Tax=Aspergillus multicolor TaxID=41759 RepID=UPI003CCDF65A
MPLIIIILTLILSVMAQNRILIGGWHILSSDAAQGSIAQWSLANADVSKWSRVGARATVLGGLVDSVDHPYNETALFASETLTTVNKSDFHVPWLYREQFSLPNLCPDQHVQLNLHGVSSKADVFLNGVQVVSSNTQKGAYAGRSYDVTSAARSGINCLLIQAYPTDTGKDLAISFADWNPAPPDSSMGVWRAVEIETTGLVSLSPLRVTHTYDRGRTSPQSSVVVTICTDVKNHGDTPRDTIINGTLVIPGGSEVHLLEQVQLLPHATSTITLEATLSGAQVHIWWPAAWGSQPLYEVSFDALLDTISDSAHATFGIRSVEYKHNADGDGQFTVNGRTFQVRGAGYAPDIFLRFDVHRLETIFRYALDIGLNTIRLEGKQEHPELYELADRLGLMIMAGWMCCDKWEGWEYNHDVQGVEVWRDEDYAIGEASMVHEAQMMQTHPSLLGFLLGSDYWPDERATTAYLAALNRMDWQNPVITSASKRGHPPQLTPSGMKMEGPYDWVPPVYWWGDKLGAAFGFASEVSAGAGTPELSSLRRFLSDHDLDRLWRKPNDGQYHQAPKDSVFHYRQIHNKALKVRYGAPTSLEDYVFKCQLMDYEATRAQFEAFAAREATGVVYWMLNSAWPSLHWQLFDYYLLPMGAYYGAKAGARLQNVVFDYGSTSVRIVNHSLSPGCYLVSADLVDTDGKTLLHHQEAVKAAPTTAKEVFSLAKIFQLTKPAFLRLVLSTDDNSNTTLSRNVYWVNGRMDTLNWENSTWYHTPTKRYADFTALGPGQLAPAAVLAVVRPVAHPDPTVTKLEIRLQNLVKVPAFFVRLTVYDHGEEVRPVFWSDNYITLFPREQLTVVVECRAERWKIKMKGVNVVERDVAT